MKSLYLILRSIILWLVSAVHFFVVCTFLVLLGLLVDPRKNDRPQRWFFRNILRLAGVGFEVRYAPGFDPTGTSFFVCNHVNIFDAFVIYSAIPQFVRGLELESHFKVPAYGWMMRRFGNVPVPSDSSPAAYKKLLTMTRDALDGGVSLIVFAEGTRTRDGRVGPFKEGVFRMAVQFGYPVVPMSIVGSYEFNRKGDWMLRPSKIVVHLHDTIETAGLTKQDAAALMDRVHRIVAGPIDDALAEKAHVASSDAHRFTEIEG
ncbi:MAG TPA: lysophospholipid acyltransferase family protein [Blastocatellia bacterium]|nr:lysophospholipid acyltransferase family protein [Blastocatellia bacterium]